MKMKTVDLTKNPKFDIWLVWDVNIQNNNDVALRSVATTEEMALKEKKFCEHEYEFFGKKGKFRISIEKREANHCLAHESLMRTV